MPSQIPTVPSQTPFQTPSQTLAPERSQASVSSSVGDHLADPSLADTLRSRRQRLAQIIDFPVLLWSGTAKSRNFAANIYPYRASSHFLYFAGLPLENAAIRMESGQLTLFVDETTPEDALWHGPQPSRDDIAQRIGADAAYPLSELAHLAMGTATLGEKDETVQMMQQAMLTRGIVTPRYHARSNQALEKAIVQLRIIQDDGAIAAIRRAIAVSVEAHQAGMRMTRKATTEAQIRATMEAVIMAHDMTCAYGSIVTTAGEVLHNHHYHNRVSAGDLLLADVGAETADGWASDITRTWPISGSFSSTQRDLYDIVLAAHDFCIEKAKHGTEYKTIHLIACQIIAAGLVDLGILRGNPEDLVAQDAHALFFPHGVGHLMGLDVHDMENLGDLAGYAEGRQRSDRFGLSFLRLDRPLQVGMVVTIEPGFYQVPGILNDRENRDRYAQMVNWERLEQFSDVRGIRIEDDILITPLGCEVLSKTLPTQAEDIEQLVKGN